MAGRRTNLALLALVPAAVLTGFLCFLVGSGPVRLTVVAHGVVGLAIVLLIPWKSTISRRGLRHRRSGHITSLALAVLVIVALVSGLLHATGVLLEAAGLSAMQVHVGAGLIALVPLVLHVRRRRTRPRQADLSRRSVLRGGALAAGSIGAYYLLAGVVALAGLPGGRRRATGSYQISSGEPAEMPSTIWLFDPVPTIDPSGWRLTVAGPGTMREVGLAEVAAGGDTVTTVLDCTNGWWSEQSWSGIRLTRLLPPGATGTVTVTSATGYRRRLPLTDDLLLAALVGGQPLTTGHGAPVRLVVPGRRGYHWVKWVVRVDHDSGPWWWQEPLPLQ